MRTPMTRAERQAGGAWRVNREGIGTFVTALHYATRATGIHGTFAHRSARYFMDGRQALARKIREARRYGWDVTRVSSPSRLGYRFAVPDRPTRRGDVTLYWLSRKEMARQRAAFAGGVE